MRDNITKELVYVVNKDNDLPSYMERITKECDDSVFMCNLSDIIDKHKNWLEKMPRVIPHYAVKANNHKALLKVLANLGASFDCASMGEIQSILALGVSPDRIVFANPAKFPLHIKFAKDNGVYLMTFDSDTELYKIKNIFPEARLVLRIKSDSNDARVSLGQKFGCEPDEATQLLELAKTLNLNVVGLSFHVGTEVRDVTCYGSAIFICRKIFDDAKSLGFDFNLLDIGGGYEGAKGTTIQLIANVVNASLEKYFPQPNIRIISEPGRYYVDSAFTLICKIHSMRRVKLPEKKSKNIKYMYYINDSVFKNFNCVVTEMKQFKPKLLKNSEDQEEYLTTIWGQTCDSTDIILENDKLPKLKLNDRLIWENMGAYTICINSPFNGFGESCVHNTINAEDRRYVENLFDFAE